MTKPSQLLADPATVALSLGPNSVLFLYDPDEADDDEAVKVIEWPYVVAQVLTDLIAANASAALTDGATITPDFGAARNFHVTLGGNRALALPTNQAAGQSGRLRITQDGTGGRTLTPASGWRHLGGELASDAGAVSILGYFVHAVGDIEYVISAEA